MDTTAATLLTENPDWRLVLEAYAQAEAEAAARPDLTPAPAAPPPPVASDDDTGIVDASPQGRRIHWVPRLAAVPDIDAAELAPIHGQLIAEGLLQFNLGSREEGMGYRLTREAKQVLSASTSSLADDSQDEERLPADVDYATFAA